MGDSCVHFIPARICERREPPGSENSWSNLWLPCVPVFLFSNLSTSSIFIHFKHLQSPSCPTHLTPPISLGPHLGGNNSIRPELVSHVVSVRRECAQTYMHGCLKLSVTHLRFAVPGHARKLQETHQAGIRLGLYWSARLWVTKLCVAQTETVRKEFLTIHNGFGVLFLFVCFVLLLGFLSFFNISKVDNLYFRNKSLQSADQCSENIRRRNMVTAARQKTLTKSFCNLHL